MCPTTSSFRLEFDILSRAVYTKHSMKSSVSGIKEITKREFLSHKKRKRSFVLKAENLDQICFVEKLKSFVATKCFHVSI